MKYFCKWFSRPDGYLDPSRTGECEKWDVVDVPKGSRVVELPECPCGLLHPLGVVSPSGEVIVCADSIRRARPEDQERPGLGEWS